MINHNWIGTISSFPLCSKRKPARNSYKFSEFWLALFDFCAPTGIRTPVVALKGLRPSPLDDGGLRFEERADFIIAPACGQAFWLFVFLSALTEQGKHIYFFSIEENARTFYS